VTEPRTVDFLTVPTCRNFGSAWGTQDLSSPHEGDPMPHGLDTDTEVFFYEHEFYPLSNFSAFRVLWKGTDFDTSEHAYQFEKFQHMEGVLVGEAITLARSAHHAFSIARARADLVRPDWHDVRVDIMRGILRAKLAQHEYIQRKLRQTGGRLLIENSWRDDFWGWGPNRDGQNMLGKLWMELRAELRTAP